MTIERSMNKNLTAWRKTLTGRTRESTVIASIMSLPESHEGVPLTHKILNESRRRIKSNSSRMGPYRLIALWSKKISGVLWERND